MSKTELPRKVAEMKLAFNDSVDSPGCTMAPRTPLAR